MTRFSQLPPDLFAYITIYLTASDLTRLVFCGTKQLITTLTVAGGASRLNFTSIKQWPLLRPAVHHFGNIKVLSIRGTPTPYYGLLPILKEKLVLPNVEALKLRGLEIWTTLLRPNTQSWMNLDPVFPNLRHLSISSSTWSWLWADSLPRGLTSLKVRAQHILTSTPTHELPPHLTRLVFVGFSIYSPNPAIAKLSQGLLELGSVSFTGIDPSRYTALTRLRICSVPAEATLPSTLTDLELFNEFDPAATTLPKFPPRITRLVLGLCNFHVTSKSASYLPKSLLELDIIARALKDPESEFYSNLPRSLLSLRVRSDYARGSSTTDLVDGYVYAPNPQPLADRRAMIDAFLTSSFPPSLTLLDIPGLDLLDDSSSRMLPRQLLRLHLWYNPRSRTRYSSESKSPGFSECGLLQLPSTLTTLHIPNYRGKLRVPEAKLLPRTLKSLQIQTPPSLRPRALAHFPPLLTWLELVSVAVLHDKHIPLLPKGLTHLSMKMGRYFESNLLTKLPSSLDSLELHSWGDRLTVDLANVPRQIRRLKIAGANRLWLEDALPPNLTELHTNSSLFWDQTEKKMARLPKSLTKLVVSNLRQSHLQTVVGALENLVWLGLRYFGRHSIAGVIRNVQYIRGELNEVKRYW